MHSTSLADQALTHHQANAVQIVDRYWHHLAVRDGIPARSAIDPRAIQDALEYAFIAEHLSAGHARLRVAGGAISATLGMEVMGMPLAVMVTPTARDSFTQQIDRMMKGPMKLTMTLAAPARFGQPALSATMRIYPLSDAKGVSKMLGTFVTTGTMGQTPRRFEITSAETTPVSVSVPASGTPIFSRGHLSLVVSN